MKKRLILAVLSMVAIQAHATSTVIAQSQTAGGMPGPVPGMCMSSEITVLSNGQVQATKCGKNPTLVLTLGKMMTTKLAMIAAGSDKNGGTIKQDVPDAPACMDAADTTISLMSSTGLVQIGGESGCNETSLHWENGAYHDEAEALQLMRSINQMAFFGR
jgi:hypothetical protein